MDHLRPLVTESGLLVVRSCSTEYDSGRRTPSTDERPNVIVVVVFDIVVTVLMNVVDDPEVTILVSNEVSNFWGAEASETHHSVQCLRVAIGERSYGVPLIEFPEKVSPCLCSLRVGVVRGCHERYNENGPIELLSSLCLCLFPFVAILIAIKSSPSSFSFRCDCDRCLSSGFGLGLSVILPHGRPRTCRLSSLQTAPIQIGNQCTTAKRATMFVHCSSYRCYKT